MGMDIRLARERLLRAIANRRPNWATIWRRQGPTGWILAHDANLCALRVSQLEHA